MNSVNQPSQSQIEDNRTKIIIALIGAFAIITAGTITYFASIKQVLLPIEATQTAEALHTAIAMTRMYTPPPSETPTIAPTNDMSPVIQEYVAVEGDTLTEISRVFLKSERYVDAIGRANCIENLMIDDKVIIKYYMVQGGDNLSRIANNFEISVQLIQYINGFDGDTIYDGQILILPIYGECE